MQIQRRQVLDIKIGRDRVQNAKLPKKFKKKESKIKKSQFKKATISKKVTIFSKSQFKKT